MSGQREKLVYSMPFRIAVSFTLFYVICFSIGAFIFYNSMQDRLVNEIDQVLEQRQSNIHRLYEEKGIDGVIQIISVTQSNDLMQLGLGYQIVDSGGEIVAANIEGFDPQDGFYNVSGATLGYGSSSPVFRFYTSSLGDHLLTVGLNKNIVGDLRTTFLSSLLLTAVLTTLLALFGAVLLANRSQRRVKNIARLMGSVGAGDLNTRLPVSYRNDDIDKLSGEMNSALTLLQQQLSGMKQVGFNIAHDLKTPLNRLYIKVEEAITLVPPGDPVLAKLEAASEDAAQINETFEVLLRIAQIEAGARKSSFVATSLKAQLQKAHEVYEVVAEELGQKIELQLQDNSLALPGDENLLLQLIVNLIENAIRHCPPDSKIILSGGTTDNIPWIRVCDTGPGIPEDEKEKVFERLYRLEKSRTTSGSGLGLSLVKAIADIHGGVITLTDNKPGLCVNVKFTNASLRKT